MNIIAVVVTFNRKDLLTRCLDALLNQSYKISKIVIIDNCSTDGTTDFLRCRNYLNHPAIDYTLLDKNVGGAGGFNIGIAAALAYKPSSVWLMDDDGWPAQDCLMELLSSNAKIKGPIVIDHFDNSKTAFLYKKGSFTTREVATLLNEPELQPIHPFNGVLISTEVIDRIGLPDPRFFIWGDEIDYRIRWLSAGYIEKVVASAHFFHPCDRQIIKRSNSRSFGVPIDCSPIRSYCFYRNQTILTKKRIGILKTVGKIVLTIKDVYRYEKNKKIFAKATFHAIFGVFGKHTQFLK